LPTLTAPPAESYARGVELRTIVLTVAVTLLNSFGNLSLTWGMKHFSKAVGLSPLPYLEAFLNPFVALGVVLLILWLLTRMALMSWADLSFVVPLSSFGYVLAAVLGKVFLHETVSRERWWGTALIFAGSVLVGSSSQRTNTAQSDSSNHRSRLNRYAA
jgi:uncharacterized membrane protein